MVNYCWPTDPLSLRAANQKSINPCDLQYRPCRRLIFKSIVRMILFLFKLSLWDVETSQRGSQQRVVKHLGKTSETGEANKNFEASEIFPGSTRPLIGSHRISCSLIGCWAGFVYSQAAGCGQSVLVCCQWRKCGEERDRDQRFRLWRDKLTFTCPRWQ